MQFLLVILSSESGFFHTDYLTTDVYNALQVILVFLTEGPKPTHNWNCQNTLNTRLIKYGQNGAINVKRAKFSKAVKRCWLFICDTAVAVPLQPIVNCCAEVFIPVNYLYLVIVGDSVRLGWRVFPKINAQVFSFCCVPAHMRSITQCNEVVQHRTMGNFVVT